MPETRPSTTTALTLKAVIDRLSRQTAVEGFIIVGSASQDKLHAASDYDLVIILSEPPIPLQVGVTYIDNRVTDLIFHTTAEVEQIIAASKPLDFWAWTGRLVGWLEVGEIVFDRHRRLQLAQEKAQDGIWLLPAGTEHGFKPWSGVNYNLQVARRCLSAADPLYHMLADIRMALYGPADLFFNYFTLRRLRWDGEKAAIRYLQNHDPQYLALFMRFISENDRSEKFGLYEQLAHLTVAPVGRLWREGETIIIVDADEVTPRQEREALDFWEELVQG